MMILRTILDSIEKGEKLLAILIDPDKVEGDQISAIINKIENSPATHIFVGGSTVKEFKTHAIVKAIKVETDLPVLIFPGDVDQITELADALLFLSLISGDNPDYLINKQVEAAPILSNINIEVISTSYLLLGTLNQSTVEKVTNTIPLDYVNRDRIINIAMAGKLLGHKITYLEAGSGAKEAVPDHIIRSVKDAVGLPLIVGGGIRNAEKLESVYNSGADIVVIGTAFEDNLDFFTIDAKGFGVE